MQQLESAKQSGKTLPSKNSAKPWQKNSYTTIISVWMKRISTFYDQTTCKWFNIGTCLYQDFTPLAGMVPFGHVRQNGSKSFVSVVKRSGNIFHALYDILMC